MSIWVHTIVHNEENYIWFAVMSVVDFVDKVMIWDTGSTDKTVEIIQEIKKIKGDKIDFKEVGSVDKFEFTKMRQAMLDETDADWVLILDGDEVWWEKSIKKVVDIIKKQGDILESIVVPFYNLVGDIYHHQDDFAGEYMLAGKKGHLTIRAINTKIPGLHLSNPYGHEGYFDKDNIVIQERSQQKMVFIDAPFLHFTHLKRSSKKQKQNKIKYELGRSFPKNFVFPEIFYQNYLDLIKKPWQKRNKSYMMKSLLKVPFLFLKRRVNVNG